LTPDKCPGCGAKLRPEMLACPNCPMSFPEDDGPPGGAFNPLKQSPLYKYMFPVLFFSAIGAAVWYIGTGLMRLGNENNQVENGNLFGEPVKGSGSRPGGSARRPAPTPPPDEGSVVITRADGDTAPSPPAPAVPFSRDEREDHSKRGRAARPTVAARPDPPPPKAPTEWKLRGTVYDLTTLKPLAGCTIQFEDAGTNRSIMTRTYSAGRYRTIVPPLSGGGYSVTIERNGYAPGYLDPGTEHVPEMSASQRKDIARDLSSTLSATPATIQSASEKPVVTDFYLAPRR
jgi:hypothetical protein